MSQNRKFQYAKQLHNVLEALGIQENAYADFNDSCFCKTIAYTNMDHHDKREMTASSKSRTES